jgi:hypothetical protein
VLALGARAAGVPEHVATSATPRSRWRCQGERGAAPMPLAAPVTEATINEPLAAGVGEHPRESLSELAKLGAG